MAACSLHPPCLALQVADRIRKHMSERVPRILPPEVEQVGGLGLRCCSSRCCCKLRLESCILPPEVER